MKYCDCVFIPNYRKKNKKILLSYGYFFGLYKSMGVEKYRDILKNGYLKYRTTQKHGAELKKVLLHYKAMIQGYEDGKSEIEKRRYNAFVYKYMTDVCVGNKAIAAKLNVSKDTVNLDINYVIEKMLVLFFGVPALTNELKDSKAFLIRNVFDNICLLNNPLPESTLCIFGGYRDAVMEIRKVSSNFMKAFLDACNAYAEDLNDAERQSTESHRREVLLARLEGKSYKNIAADLQIDISLIYDISKENERRLAEMIFC